MALPALAQYPERPITIVVPYAAGSGNDAYARLIADGLQEKLKQTVIVENMPGAGGLIGAAAVAQAAPDGYTLMTHSSSLASGQVMRANPEFDARTAFAPIAQYSSSPAALVVTPGLPIETVNDLIEYAKSNPVNYGSSGVGGITHLNVELLKQRSGLVAEHVPYGGGAEAIPATTGGEVQFLLIDIGAVLAAIESDQIKLIAVAGNERIPLKPDVPTIKESGIDFAASVNYGLFAPAGTPPDIVALLNTTVNEIIASDRFRSHVEGRGGAIVLDTPEAFGKVVASEVEELGGLVDSLGIEKQ
jgi:tripartite-type tricarboxylate transporter receptor subunit TctC